MGGVLKYKRSDTTISFNTSIMIIILAVLASRLPTLWITSIDIDAGIFALVARELVDGHLPYNTVFDHKPIALYYPLAAMMKVFGSNSFAVNLTSAVMVMFTCIALFFYSVSQGVSRIHSIGLSVCYSIMTCGYQGYASLSEINVNAFMAISFASIGNPQITSLSRKVLAGIFFGAAFHSNYMTGFALIGFGISYLVSLHLLRKEYALIAIDSISFVSGFIIATFLLILPLLVWGDLYNYFQEQRNFLSGYMASRDPMAFLLQLLPFSPVLALIAALFIIKRNDHELQSSPPYWIFGATLGFIVAIFIGGRSFAHYFLFLMPGLSFSLAWALGGIKNSSAVAPIAVAAFLGQAISAYGHALYTFQSGAMDLIRTVSGQPPRHDVEAKLVEAASKIASPGDLGYVACASPIIYVALELKPATRFAMYPHHLNSLHAESFGIKPEEELMRIVDRRPSIVIFGDFRSCVWVSQEVWRSAKAAFETAGYEIVQDVEGFTIMRPSERSSRHN